jgi:hypothetical protein
MRLIWPNEVVAANVSNSANAFNATWVDMADAKESNDGKFDFCQTMTTWVDMADAKESNDGKFDFCQMMASLSSVSFQLFAFS